jgi:hypothetical protein
LDYRGEYGVVALASRSFDAALSNMKSLTDRVTLRTGRPHLY